MRKLFTDGVPLLYSRINYRQSDITEMSIVYILIYLGSNGFAILSSFMNSRGLNFPFIQS